MKRQLSFVDWIISRNISEDDPLKKIFSSIDFSFIRTIIPEASLGREGFDPVSLFKALLLIPLGEDHSQRHLARKLRFDGRLSYLCGFSYGKTPSHNTFTVFKKRVGEKRFREILETLAAQALADAAYDSLANISFSEKEKIQPFIACNPRNSKNSTLLSHLTITPEGEVFCPAGKQLIYWGKEKRRERMKFRCPLNREKGDCLFKNSCWKGKYGKSFYISTHHRLSEKMKLFRATKRFKKIYKKRQAIERFFSLLKESFSLDKKMRVRGAERVRIYVYLVLSAYVVSLSTHGFG
ncbi:MAG: transposase [Candidatus Aminicenantes bacterium]|nr:transposase [Candidatus Aminicenantes bacterium]